MTANYVNVPRESGRFVFTDPRTGKRYEIVVREIAVDDRDPDR